MSQTIESSSNINHARRNLFRGKIDRSAADAPLRGPFAILEPLFIHQCTQCDECINACPENILFKGSGGFPEVSFEKSQCDFCQECLSVCESHALMAMTPAWDLKAHLSQAACLAHTGIMCQSCRDSCEVDAIEFRFSTQNIAVPTINNELCTGCGECQRACPEQAIKIDHGI